MGRFSVVALGLARGKQRRPRGQGLVYRHERVLCEVCGKRRFRDRSQARDALDVARWERAAGRRWRREQRFYRCRFCDGWHLTSQSLSRGPWDPGAVSAP